MGTLGWLVLATLAGVAAVLVVRARAAARREAARAEAIAAEVATLREEADRQDDARDAILGTMREGVLLLDGDGGVVYANPALERHLGARPGSAGDLFPLALRDAVAAPPATLEVELGSPARWLAVRAEPTAVDGAVLLIVRDVTARRRLDAVRRDFVANASHELKSPAATIRAAAEMLAQAAEDDPAAVPRFAAQLERQSLRLSRIVNDLLDLSRLEAGGAAAEVVRLDALVREESQRVEDEADDAGLTLTTETPDAVTVRGSDRDLALLTRNLIENALRYTPTGGTITVRVIATPGGGSVLEVRDTGIGIPSRDLPRVFERFYRVDRARARGTGGTGLGLAIAKHVADNHGASIDLTSELGAGTTVRVTFAAGDDAP
ncbi:MAG TPA: ATP-binding protein [Actinomycetota bacterium]|nr:ATP-binding protein [Actinomycetota bacterium]